MAEAFHYREARRNDVTPASSAPAWPTRLTAGLDGWRSSITSRIRRRPEIGSRDLTSSSPSACYAALRPLPQRTFHPPPASSCGAFAVTIQTLFELLQILI